MCIEHNRIAAVQGRTSVSPPPLYILLTAMTSPLLSATDSRRGIVHSFGTVAWR